MHLIGWVPGLGPYFAHDFHAWRAQTTVGRASSQSSLGQEEPSYFPTNALFRCALCESC